MRCAWSLAALGLASTMGLGLMLSERGTADDRNIRVDVGRGGVNVDVGHDSPDGPGFYRATEVIGTVIKDEANEALGKVQDIVIDGRTQEVRYLLLGEGEAVATEGDLIIVPFASVRPHFVVDGGDRYFTIVNFNRARLGDAPRITVANLRNFRETRWMGTADKFYGVNVRVGGQDRNRRDGARDGDSRRDNSRDTNANRDGNDSANPPSNEPNQSGDTKSAPKTAPKTTPRTAPKADPNQPAPRKAAPPAPPKSAEPAPKSSK